MIELALLEYADLHKVGGRKLQYSVFVEGMSVEWESEAVLFEGVHGSVDIDLS